jgi:negative regulator of flagellin synthesis FlgM
MKVDSQNGGLSSINLYHSEGTNNQGSAEKSVDKGAPRGVDRIDISPQARQVDKLKKEMATIPEVRLDKVALMKQQLVQGTYKVDATAVAEKMMNSLRR